MLIASSTLGCSTLTCWKRRSSALSSPMCCRYSFSVVAPMQRSSPLASIGFSRFDASMEPLVAPAPTTVWISSMKSTTSPALSLTSFSTAFSRSSNSPRYLAPAISAPMSSATSRRFWRDSGTSPETMRCARPSAMAVLPTPGSPRRIGLFFVRRERICVTRRISSSRPITGSSLPSAASFVRSRPYCSRASYVFSGLRVSAFWLPRTRSIAARREPSLTPCASSALRPMRSRSVRKRPSSRCSLDTYESPYSFMSAMADVSTDCRLWPIILLLVSDTCGCRAMYPSTSRFRRAGSTLASVSTFWLMLEGGSSTSAFISSSLSTVWHLAASASCGSRTIALHAFSV